MTALVGVPRLRCWRTNLTSVVTVCPARPFEWGAHDCCLGLAVPAIQAVIGVDLGAPYRGQYTTALGALMALKRQGFETLADLADSQFARQAAGRARVGDLAAIQAGETGWALGVVTGPRIAVLTPAGFATVDLLKASHTYRVG